MVRSAFGDEIRIGPDAIAARSERRKWNPAKFDFCYLDNLQQIGMAILDKDENNLTFLIILMNVAKT